jgi:2,4-dienoyl-CoA reductase (NADPH2)
MARALIADPEMPKKAMKGKSNTVYHCIACNQGCFDMIFLGHPVTCTVNPMAGIEKATEISPAAERKKVLIIGGGPAGMKAACTAAARGHKVILAEKTNRLGGQLLLNRDIPGRGEMVKAAEDLINNMHSSQVEILLETEADAAFVNKLSPDALILATGAAPIMPDIDGIADEKVISAWDLLSGMGKTGKRVVIIGGNAVGLETAIYLSHIGTISPETLHFLAVHRAETWDTMEALISRGIKEVTVVEMLTKYGRDIGVSTRWSVLDELKRMGVRIIAGARAVAVRKEGLEIEKGESREIIPADSIVTAVGAKPENILEKTLKGLVKEIHVVGDAAGPRKALDAIREGFMAGLRV